MKQNRSIITLAITALAALMSSLVSGVGPTGVAAAQPLVPPTNVSREVIGRELTVTAVVPAHRDIVVSPAGKILEITSNTPEDVMPQVYSGSVAPENLQELTPELLEEYRRLVPQGTAEYGKLYEAPMVERLGLAASRQAWL